MELSEETKSWIEPFFFRNFQKKGPFCQSQRDFFRSNFRFDSHSPIPQKKGDGSYRMQLVEGFLVYGMGSFRKMYTPEKLT